MFEGWDDADIENQIEVLQVLQPDDVLERIENAREELKQRFIKRMQEEMG